jgi:hypothetical protein
MVDVPEIEAARDVTVEQSELHEHFAECAADLGVQLPSPTSSLPSSYGSHIILLPYHTVTVSTHARSVGGQ